MSAVKPMMTGARMPLAARFTNAAARPALRMTPTLRHVRHAPSACSMNFHTASDLCWWRPSRVCKKEAPIEAALSGMCWCPKALRHKDQRTEAHEPGLMPCTHCKCLYSPKCNQQLQQQACQQTRPHLANTLCLRTSAVRSTFLRRHCGGGAGSASGFSSRSASFRLASCSSALPSPRSCAPSLVIKSLGCNTNLLFSIASPTVVRPLPALAFASQRPVHTRDRLAPCRAVCTRSRAEAGHSGRTKSTLRALSQAHRTWTCPEWVQGVGPRRQAQ